MPYYTGSAANHADLWDKLQVHAALTGWVGSYVDPFYIFEKDSLKISLEKQIVGTGSDRLECKIETTGIGTYNLGVKAEYNNVKLTAQESDPVISYHAFIDIGATPSIFVAFEVLPNIWRHVQFGILDKIGSWQGGAYLFTTYADSPTDWDSNSNASIGLNSTSLTNRHGVMSFTDDLGGLVFGSAYDTSWYAAGTTRNIITTGFSFTTQDGPSSSSIVVDYVPNPTTGELIMVPIEVFVIRDGSLWSRAGSIPNITLVNSRYMQEAQEVIIDADTWMFFPIRANGYIIDTGLPEESGYMGYAYKK